MPEAPEVPEPDDEVDEGEELPLLLFCAYDAHAMPIMEIRIAKGNFFMLPP